MAAEDLEHLLPIKIGFENPGLKEGGVVFGMGWSCGTSHHGWVEWVSESPVRMVVCS
jgi:hypothetical protein